VDVVIAEGCDMAAGLGCLWRWWLVASEMVQLRGRTCGALLHKGAATTLL
jgi:hypothetical protein